MKNMVPWIKKKLKQRQVAKARKLWTAALRSGQYKQGFHRLRRRNEFCCLGVACEVYQKNFGDLTVSVDSDNTYFYDGDNSGLPPKVRRWLDMDGPGRYSWGARCLTELNDKEGLDFQAIANVIETETFVGA